MPRKQIISTQNGIALAEGQMQAQTDQPFPLYQ